MAAKGPSLLGPFDSGAPSRDSTGPRSARKKPGRGKALISRGPGRNSASAGFASANVGSASGGTAKGTRRAMATNEGAATSAKQDSDGDGDGATNLSATNGPTDGLLAVERLNQTLPIPKINQGNLTFRHMPEEVQRLIAGEATRKPAMHFVVVRPASRRQRLVLNGQDYNNILWWIRLFPKPVKIDTSVFRSTTILSRINHTWNKLVHEKFIKPAMLGIASGGWRPMVDAAVDLVVFEFDKFDPIKRWNVQPTSQNSHGLWNVLEDHWPRLSKRRVTERVSFIPRVGLAVKFDQEPDQDPLWPAFKCSCPGREHHDRTRNRFCPREVAGFLDCFAELEEAFLIIEPAPEWLPEVVSHMTMLHQTNRGKPEAEKAQVFYDSTSAYYEVSPDHLTKKYPEGVWDAFESMIRIRDALIADIVSPASFQPRLHATGFFLSKDRRLKVKFRVLLKTRESHFN